MEVSLFGLLLATGVTDLFIFTSSERVAKSRCGIIRIYCSSFGIELLDGRVKRVVSYRKQGGSG